MEAYLEFGSRSLSFGAPRSIVVAHRVEDVEPALEAIGAAGRDGAYAVGFVAYEAAPAFDDALTVHQRAPGLPLVWFGLHDAPTGAPRREPHAYACSVWTPSHGAAAHHASVDTIRAAIARGDTYQVNMTLEMAARFDGDPLGAWEDLRGAQSSGWFAYIDTGDHVVVSVSPELFFRWDARRVVTRPMKGTRARSAVPETDHDLAAELRSSVKDRAENVMIVDLLRNDLGKICVPGSIDVPALFEIEAYPTLWQMTSTVTGRTEATVGVPQLFRALFPCGSVTGAPKPSTMRIIDSLERRPRGVYCGAVGVVGPGDAATFNVAIRTMVVDRAAGTASYGAGGGIVWDSDPHAEHDEAHAKAAVLAATQRRFELVETMRFDGAAVTLLDRHLDRMEASAAWFGRPFDRAWATAVVGAISGGPQRVRLTLAADATLQCTTTPVPQASTDTQRVVLASEPVWSGDPWLRHKTTLRSVYDHARAEDPEAFDTLLWNERGELTETTIANLVVALDGALVTPPLSCGLLPGTLRAELLASGILVERVVHVGELRRAEALWMINSVRGWIPIVAG